MNDAAKREILKIARDTVAAASRGQRCPDVKPVEPELREPRGAFVTIKNKGRLRGCIGRFVADAPLWEIVQEMAVSSATGDPRFTPVTPDELPDLSVEISVIGPLEKIADPLDFTLGVHGVYIRRGGAHGCFLPQVARETGWSKEQFLSECAEGKAGLGPEAWRDPKTEVLRFSCEVISE